MLVGAHRGYSAIAPENTLVSFEKAIQAGADLIECDVQLTRDCQAVIIHDEWVDRTSDGHGMVKDMTLSQLRNLDFGLHKGKQYEGTRIATLDEVLDLARGRVIVNLEIKNGPVYYAGIEEAVARAVHSRNMEHQVIISSFDHPAVLRLARLLPQAATGLLFQHLPLSVQSLVSDALVTALHPYYAYVTESLVRECRSLGLALNVWGTNDPAEWERLLKLGVNSIITDYPEELARLAGRLV